MEWLINIFGTSDYAERDPYRKLAVALSHAWLGGFLVIVGFPIWLVVAGYAAKEIAFDLARVVVFDRSKLLNHIWRDRWLVADSIVDWIFTYLGAACVAYANAWYGVGILAIGAAYFIAEKVYGNQ